MGLEAVCSLMLGRRMGFLAENADKNPKVTALINAVKQLFITQRDSYHGIGLWKYFPTKTYNDFVESEEIIYSIISDIVDTALEEQKLEFNDNEFQNAFISILSAKNVDIRDKKSAIIDFIAAGIETVSLFPF